MDRLLVVLGALFGVSGVGAAAAAAHIAGPDTTLDTASNFLLFHAPALMAIPALGRAGTVHARVAGGAGLLIACGVSLFSGELALRALEGKSLFQMAAPTGGVLLMAGWLGIAAAALSGSRRQGDRLHG